MVMVELDATQMHGSRGASEFRVKRPETSGSGQAMAVGSGPLRTAGEALADAVDDEAESGVERLVALRVADRPERLVQPRVHRQRRQGAHPLVGVGRSVRSAASTICPHATP